MESMFTHNDTFSQNDGLHFAFAIDRNFSDKLELRASVVTFDVTKNIKTAL